MIFFSILVKMKPVSQIGIWIDLNEAIMATGDEIIDVINSNFTVGHVKGGSGSSTPYGAQDAVSESKVLEKRKQSLRLYFEDIMDRITHYKKVMIMGPGQVKHQLEETIRQSHKTKHISLTVEAADKMTLNQIRARVRNLHNN